MKLKLTTTQAYYRKRRIWAACLERQSTLIRGFFPDTGGSAHLMHNWYACSKDPAKSGLADWITESIRGIEQRLQTRLGLRDEDRRANKALSPFGC